MFYLQIVASETLALGSSEKKLSTVLNLRVNSYYPLIQLLAILVNEKLEEEHLKIRCGFVFVGPPCVERLVPFKG